MSVSVASEMAKRWCERNPKWQRMCDIENSDALMLSFDEIPDFDRRGWTEKYGDRAEEAWREFCVNRPTRHRRGHIGEDGLFYQCITSKPVMMNSMMVFETRGKPGIYYVSGQKTKGSRGKVTVKT